MKTPKLPRRLLAALAVIAAGGGPLQAPAQTPPADPLQREAARQAEATTIDMQVGLNGDPLAYKGDNKPETLEVVLLDDARIPSQVTSGGEVILMHRSDSDAAQQALFKAAFEQRARRALGLDKS